FCGPPAAPAPRAPEPPSEPPATSAGPRDWDFAMPAPAPAPLHPQDPLIDFDSNLRHQSGLRPPAETNALPESSRERFSENWERMAFVAPRHRRSRLRRKLEGSKVTGWMF